MGRGSISAAVAIGAVTLVAALGIAWGALNLANRHTAAPATGPAAVTAPASRGDQDFLRAAPAVRSIAVQTYDFRGNRLPTSAQAFADGARLLPATPFVAPTYDFRGNQPPITARDFVSGAGAGATLFVGDSLVSKPDATPVVTHTTHPRHRD
jgi:hypothetical protein